MAILDALFDLFIYFLSYVFQSPFIVLAGLAIAFLAFKTLRGWLC